MLKEIICSLNQVISTSLSVANSHIEGIAEMKIAGGDKRDFKQPFIMNDKGRGIPMVLDDRKVFSAFHVVRSLSNEVPDEKFSDFRQTKVYLRLVVGYSRKTFTGLMYDNLIQVASTIPDALMPRPAGVMSVGFFVESILTDQDANALDIFGIDSPMNTTYIVGVIDYMVIVKYSIDCAFC